MMDSPCADDIHNIAKWPSVLQFEVQKIKAFQVNPHLPTLPFITCFSNAPRILPMISPIELPSMGGREE